MTGLDWIIVALVSLLAVYGWTQGFIAGALSLAGLVAGVWIGTRIGPLILSGGSKSPWAPAFGLAGGLLLGGLVAGLLEVFGSALRGVMRVVPGFGLVDGLLGAALIACAGLAVVWVLGALALQNAGFGVREQVRRSVIVQRLTTLLPPSGGLLNSLRRLDPFPEIQGPDADVQAPRAAIARDADVRAAARSVVRILGSACGVGVEGSGWAAGRDLVVTNAHVVAGQDDTRVLREGSGSELPARAVWFDPRNDVAILAVPGLEVPALPLATAPEPGTAAAILGFPLNGPYDVRAGRIGVTRRVLSSDAYGRGPVSRSMTALRGLVRSGNSGGPMVDGDGRVQTTIFAAATRGPRGGYGVPNGIVRDALARASGPVSTGPCAP